MNENRRYYYLKVKESFYNSETMVILESMPDGMIYSNLLMKMYLMSLKNNGVLMLNDRIRHTPQTIATYTHHQISTVEQALKIFTQLGLVEVLSDGTYYMSDIQLLIGQSSSESERKKRERLRLAHENLLPSAEADPCPPIVEADTCRPPMEETDKCPPIAEVDKCPPIAEVDKCPPIAEVDKCPPIAEVDKCPPILERELELELESETETERESERARATGHPAPAAYGRYHNVFLADADLAELQSELPGRWQHYIERLSEYIASTGRTYRNHAATIRRWAADDAGKGAKTRTPDYSYKEGESL